MPLPRRGKGALQQELDRNEPPRSFVIRLVHHPLPTPVDLGYQPVARNGVSRCDFTPTCTLAGSKQLVRSRQKPIVLPNLSNCDTAPSTLPDMQVHPLIDGFTSRQQLKLVVIRAR
jgi:hypothetical protein